ncbi:MAG TPA: ATP-binding protein, partial [Gemmataceae bacterium]|nr:ATP-binding protein [Gemmataceae bacterium]
RVEAAEAESLAQTKPFDCEFRVRTRAGAEHWVHCRSAPQRLSDGSVAWVGLLTDVTAGKRAEEEAREEARRKDKFISMLAHELRNPLAPIGNAMHLLARSRESAVVDKVQDIVTRQVAHLSRVVDDLLDASRVARGQAQLRRERVDLGRVARQASEDQAASFGKAGVALAADVPDTPVWVEGDRTRLTQVVTNLLANAAKFTDRGGRATVGVRRDRGQAVLTVADTGVGMDAATLARLFEPFAQADQSLARTRGGLGLGLALVKGFVELHDGTVTAASAGPGKGSEFTVRLPLAPEPPAVTAAPLPAARPAPVRKRVLIVEDNKDAADSLRMVFEMTGYDVTVAYTGPDGAEAARRVRPDLVICDIGLPGMDGYAVARRIRADLAAERPVLVALTGYGEAADRDRALAAGFDRHFTKPADPAALEAALTTRT